MRRIAVGAALVLVAIACADGDGRITGTVVGLEAEGDAVESFEVLAEEGRRITFQVPETLTEFSHGGPLTHLLQHLQTGAPVQVTYHREGEAYVVDAVDDG